MSIIQCKAFEGYPDTIAQDFNDWAKRNHITQFKLHDIKYVRGRYNDSNNILVFYHTEVEEPFSHNVKIESLD